MYVVELRVKSTRSNEQVDARVIVEEWRNGRWQEKETFHAVYGMEAPQRKLLLLESERVIVETKDLVEIVWDKEQNAAVPRRVVREETRNEEDVD